MSERTLGEIIDSVRDGQPATADEMRYALCAMESLAVFDRRALGALYEAEESGKKRVLTGSAKWQAEESFRRHKGALNTPPKKWIGWDHDPDNPEARERRGKALKLMSAIAAKQEQKAGKA